jgi:DNA-binding beta-propeller fold protein YncE
MTTAKTRTRTYEYDHTIGIDDFAGRAFRCAVDVTLGPQGMIYVLQRGTPLHRNVSVKMCNFGEEFFGDFGAYGSEPGQWVWPAAIVMDSQQRLYVSDEWNQRISCFDSKGGFLGEWGEAGSKPGQLSRPSGLALDPQENLLVVDSGNHRVQRFTRDGKYLSGWGTQGTGPGQFNMPWGVAVNGVGEAYVTDWRNDRVQKFDANGRFLLEWGTAGSGEGQFNRPAGITTDRDGDVYVVDWHNNRVQVFHAQGAFLTQLQGDATMSTWGEQLLAANPEMMAGRKVAKDLSTEKRFWVPRGIRVDDQGRVVVVDSGKGRLQIYRKVSR